MKREDNTKPNSGSGCQNAHLSLVYNAPMKTEKKKMKKKKQKEKKKKKKQQKNAQHTIHPLGFREERKILSFFLNHASLLVTLHCLTFLTPGGHKQQALDLFLNDKSLKLSIILSVSAMRNRYLRVVAISEYKSLSCIPWSKLFVQYFQNILMEQIITVFWKRLSKITLRLRLKALSGWVNVEKKFMKGKPNYFEKMRILSMNFMVCCFNLSCYVMFSSF